MALNSLPITINYLPQQTRKDTQNAVSKIAHLYQNQIHIKIQQGSL